MDATQLTLIASGVGLGVQTLSLALQGYTAFKKSNVELFFEKLLNSDKDISNIGTNEELQRYFFKVIDEVAVEANVEKLDAWKNAVIHLVSDFTAYEFKDNYMKLLSDLTVFDLTVLYTIYSINFKNVSIQGELFEYYEHKNVKSEYVMLSVKRLASNNLIGEHYANYFSFAGTDDSNLDNLKYAKNSLGKEFLDFISDIY